MKQHTVLYQNSVMKTLIRKQIRFFTQYTSQLIEGKGGREKQGEQMGHCSLPKMQIYSRSKL